LCRPTALPVSCTVHMTRRYICAVALLFIVILANYNIVFLGQSLVASANYHPFDYRLTHLRPGNFSGNYAFANWHDLGSAWWQWEPAAAAFSRSFRSGRIPLWDPSLAGGTDTHVGLVQGQYYPPYMLLLFAGNSPLLRDMYYLAQVFLSGLFLCLLLTANGVHRIAAVAGGTAYMLSGVMTQNVNTILGQSYAILPGMAWASDYVLRKATWRAAAAAAGLLAFFSLSSFLPVVISGYFIAGLLACADAAARLWAAAPKGAHMGKPAFRPFAMACAAIVISVCMLGFLLWPVHVASSSDAELQKWYPGLGLQHFTPDRLLTLISPSVSYDVWQLQDRSGQLFADPHMTGLFYAGLIPILLALFAYSRDLSRLRLVAFFTAVVIVTGLKLIGVPPFQWLGYLPVLKNLHFVPYFSGALGFGIAGLAALGTERLMRRRDAEAAAIAVTGVAAVLMAVLRFAQNTPLNTALKDTALWAAVAREGVEVARLLLLAFAFIALVIFRSRMRDGRTAALLALALVVLMAGTLLALRSRRRGM